MPCRTPSPRSAPIGAPVVVAIACLLGGCGNGDAADDAATAQPATTDVAPTTPDVVLRTESGETLTPGTEGTGRSVSVVEPPKELDPDVVKGLRFPDHWFWKDPGNPAATERPPAVKALETKLAPPLQVTEWYGGDPVGLDALRGKVVVIQFWATNRPVAMRTIARNRRLVEEYGDRGVVLIGVHETGPAAKALASAVESFDLNYPVCLDVDGKTVESYAVTMWPCYSVLDHLGYLRANGVIPSRLNTVIDRLLELRTRDLGEATTRPGP